MTAFAVQGTESGTYTQTGISEIYVGSLELQ